MSYLVKTENISEYEEQLDGFNDYYQMTDFISERIAHWNNFHGELPLILKIERLNDENTIGISVSDQTQTTEKFS